MGTPLRFHSQDRLDNNRRSLHVVKPSFSFIPLVHHKLATQKKVDAKHQTHWATRGSQFPRKGPGGPTHRAVAHAGGRCQCLLQGLGLPQHAWLGWAHGPLTGQQVAENVAVAPQCAVDQRALAFLIQVVHLGGGRNRGRSRFSITSSQCPTHALHKPHPTAGVRG